jgi:DNA ligase-associated metallophosphoesterase
VAITDTWVTEKVATGRISIVKFAELLWLLDARGVAYIPALDYLVVSDLHFEKGSFLRSYGNPLPSLDTRATLMRLRSVIEDYMPAKVISLGDSFHDKHSMTRMTEQDTVSLFNLVNQVPHWNWVEGNHDPFLPAGVPGSALNKLTFDQLCFQHEPTTCYQNDTTNSKPLPKYQVIGHYHPKLTTKVSQRRYSGKCFVMGNHMMIMPAFGQFTGGLDANEQVLKDLIPVSERACYLMCDDIIFKALPSRR